MVCCVIFVASSFLGECGGWGWGGEEGGGVTEVMYVTWIDFTEDGPD